MPPAPPPHRFLRFLLQQPDMDPNAVDADGNTALHLVLSNPEVLCLRGQGVVTAQGALGGLGLG